jgi:hypothetical protein
MLVKNPIQKLDREVWVAACNASLTQRYDVLIQNGPTSKPINQLTPLVCKWIVCMCSLYTNDDYDQESEPLEHDAQPPSFLEWTLALITRTVALWNDQHYDNPALSDQLSFVRKLL